jgi:hypothetical protein
MGRRARGMVIAGACLAALVGLGAPSAAADPDPTPPPRTNSTNETVYLVKGYDPDGKPGVSCAVRWDGAIRAMQDWGWKGQFVRVGFYQGDKKGCDINLAKKDGTRDLGIKELGRRLAWNIYLSHSRWDRSVDLVGHSMGSLIIRAAVAGTERREKGWPPYIYVEDAVTLGGPHYGSWVATYCKEFTPNRQCVDMVYPSPFQNWLHRTGVAKHDQGTDWTLVGSKADGTVQSGSAVPASDGAQHLVLYAASSNIGHSDLRKIVDRRWPMRLSNNGGGSWVSTTHGAAPVRAALNALYWESTW